VIGDRLGGDPGTGGRHRDRVAVRVEPQVRRVRGAQVVIQQPAGRGPPARYRLAAEVPARCDHRQRAGQRESAVPG